MMDKVEKFLHKIGAYRLKDLIRAIRACKTAAAERAVISKESAFIRTSIKEDTGTLRYINVSKLLYIHMLGYPAHFGQLECLKLVASTKFTDKKLGYLGIMMLLDENQEILTLVTNSLQNDLNSPNPFVVSLALCTLGNIASLDMTRDLTRDIERLISTSNTFIKKKALLCALRIVKKNPDSKDIFIPIVKNVLNERNHGVLLTGCTLLLELCNLDESFRLDMQTELVPVLVKHMKNLCTTGYSTEHDVNGITDPFLQVKILKLMGVLGRGSVEASDFMNDTLAQVATNTESAKNVGNAILYECVLTIMDIKSDSSLRVLAINILAKFLANKDNNIRYVGLTTLTRTSTQSTSVIQEPSSFIQSSNNDALISEFLGESPKLVQEPTQNLTAVSDSNALQRHRAIILECLKDSDISIRSRALDLAFLLITKDNIRILTRELLAFLEVCEKDIKISVSSRLVDYASRFRPNNRWLADTVIRTLRVAGAYVDQNVVNRFIKLVGSQPDNAENIEINKYVVRKLFNLIFNEVERAFEQEGLVIAAVWCIGEYGDILVQGGNENTKNTFFADKGIYMKEDDRKRQLALNENTAYAIDSSDDNLDEGYGDFNDSDMTTDIKNDKPMEDKDLLIDIFDNLTNNGPTNSSNKSKGVATSGSTAQNDLFDIFSNPVSQQQTNSFSSAQNNNNNNNSFSFTNTSTPTTNSNTNNNNVNLLDDLFGGSSNLNSNSNSNNGPVSTTKKNPLDDLLGGFGTSTNQPITSTPTISNKDPLADILGGFGTSQPKPLNNTSSMGKDLLDDIWGSSNNNKPQLTSTPIPQQNFNSPISNISNNSTNSNNNHDLLSGLDQFTSNTPTTTNNQNKPIQNNNLLNTNSLLSDKQLEDESTEDIEKIPTEDVVLDVLEAVLKANRISSTIKEYVVMALLKLYTRFRTDSSSRLKIVELIGQFNLSHNLELQQRAIEAGIIINQLDQALIETVTERIPIVDSSDAL